MGIRITIVTIGSTGDVTPFAALGLGLESAGHEVSLATFPAFEGFVREQGLRFRPLSGDPEEILRSLARGGVQPASLLRLLGGSVGPLLQKNFAECLEACRDADAVIYSQIAFFGQQVAEALGIPAIGAGLQPILSRTSHFPSAIMPIDPGLSGALSRPYNRMSYKAVEQLLWQPLRGSVNRARKNVLGLAPLSFDGPFRRSRKEGWPILYGWSPSLLPKPPDWTQSLSVTGHWYLDRSAHWKPPRELVDFIESGPPPVCIGFGGTVLPSPEASTEVVLGALRRTGDRAVLLSGRGGLGGGSLPDEVFVADEIPHEWLLPRMKAHVHHCSAGTTAAAIRAGVPSVGVPFYGDQNLWATLLQRAGAGAKLPASRLSPERLADALSRASASKSETAARRLAERVRDDEGVERAVRAFHHHLSTSLS